MAHDVFISHSSKDKLIADAICANLEGARIRCWISSRDIAFGEDWHAAITRAISQSRVMVLVFSTNSNSSNQVLKELGLADRYKLLIIPFKIDDVRTEPAIEYLLQGTHWLDAINPPMQEHINSLVERVRAVIQPTAIETTSSAQPTLTPLRPPMPARPVWIGPVIGVAIVLVVTIGILFASQTLFAPASTLVPTAIAIAPIAAPSATAAATATSVPTVIAATNTPVAPASSATATALPTATMPPITTATPKPTVPQPAIPPDKILFEEHFDDPQYDGSLPPSLTPDRLGAQSFIQRNGALQVLAVGNDINVNTNAPIIPAQFRFLQARIKVASPWSTAAYLGGMTIFLFNQTPHDEVDLACFPLIAMIGCGVGGPLITVPSYDSSPIRVQSDVWYVVRMELANAETLEWRFYLNDTRIG